MPPQSGLGEEIQNTQDSRMPPHAHAWGYFKTPSGLKSAVKMVFSGIAASTFGF